MSSVMFVFVLLVAAVLSNILANFFKALSVACPNYKCGVLGFGCSIKVLVRSFSDWKIWLMGFVVGISILEGSKCTVSEIRLPPVSVMNFVWHI